MSAFPNTISIEVCADTHAVSVWAGVERWGVKADCTTINSISVAPANIGDYTHVSFLHKKSGSPLSTVSIVM